jgi:hypothetical protein
MRARVAAQALGVHFFGRSLCGIEYLGYVSAAGNVLTARTMAALTGYSGAAVLQGKLAMWIVGEPLGYLRMAGRAGIAAYIGG